MVNDKNAFRTVCHLKQCATLIAEIHQNYVLIIDIRRRISINTRVKRNISKGFANDPSSAKPISTVTMIDTNCQNVISNITSKSNHASP